MSWVGNTIVTSSVLPHPQNERLVVFPVGGGTSGAVQVEVVGSSGSGGGSVEISGVLPQFVDGTGSLPVVVLGAITASVDNWPAPVTGVSVLNLPTTQSVYVVNPSSGSVSIVGVNAVSGALQVTGTVEVAGLAFSGTVSIPIEAYPNALENIQFTRKKQLFDFDSDTVNYIGYASLGADPSSAAWAIKRLSFNASGNLESSEWSGLTASWSNRVSEAYA
jgi:hypothetical protein